MTERMPLQPDPDPAGETLVQQEGVNAGSEHSTVESRQTSSPPAAQPSADARDAGTPPHGDPLHPGGPMGQSGGSDDQQAEDEVLSGAPETTPPAPGQYGAESGQDSGSMA